MIETLLAHLLREAADRAAKARQSAANLSLMGEMSKVPAAKVGRSFYLNTKIHEALMLMPEHISNSYIQIVSDFEDETRVSWAGTAHEIRELLRHILEHLAPDNKVTQAAWYVQQKDTSGPTQKQKVRYILSQTKGDSKQQKVAQDIDIIDAKVGDLVRDVYGRASDAAHRSKNKTEAFKILRYFEAFAYDLLDLSA
ncbi:MAG: hypothetical protein JWL85_377 [Candidatus Saccharibacteria bacterium]|nr:hypothetical protein [Candidatus Saccharibacteria bacterium]